MNRANVGNVIQEGKQTLEVDPSFGRTATATTEENIGRVHHMLIAYRRLDRTQIANAISISLERVENILHNEHDMTKVTSNIFQKSVVTRQPVDEGIAPKVTKHLVMPYNQKNRDNDKILLWYLGWICLILAF